MVNPHSWHAIDFQKGSLKETLMINRMTVEELITPGICAEAGKYGYNIAHARITFSEVFLQKWNADQYSFMVEHLHDVLNRYKKGFVNGPLTI